MELIQTRPIVIVCNVINQGVYYVSNNILLDKKESV